MKAAVDKELCTGCGLCANSCPDVFEMEGDVAVAVSGDIPENEQSCARDAANDCPVEAISVVE